MRRIAGFLFVALALSSMPARAIEVQLPNLVPYKASGIRIATADGGVGKAIRFDTTTANLGDHHFEILGGLPESTTESQALQCVQWEGRVCLDRQQVGTFTLHPQHRHWHLDGYASYELRRLAPDGTPDMSPAGLVVDGGKVSFCLLDVEATDQAKDFPEDPFAYTGYYVGCFSVIQGISQGWADVYDSSLFGQQLKLDGVTDGSYAIVITVDPDNTLLEMTHEDNMSWRAIELSGNGTVVKPL